MMKHLILAAAFAAAGAVPALAQDKDLDELKRGFEKSMKGLQEKFEAERARLEKEFKAAREKLAPKVEEQKKELPKDLEGLVRKLLERVEQLEKRLEGGRLMEKFGPQNFDFKRFEKFGEKIPPGFQGYQDEMRKWLERMPRFRGGREEEFRFEFRKTPEKPEPKKEEKKKGDGF
jgi:hypothetical protein